MHVTIRLEPSGVEFASLAGQAILDAGLAAGVALPHSCRRGNCRVCKAGVTSGTCAPTRAPGLGFDPADGAGTVLMCSATAMSDLVLRAEVLPASAAHVARTFPARVEEISPVDNSGYAIRLRVPRHLDLTLRPGQHVETAGPGGKRTSHRVMRVWAADAPALEIMVAERTGDGAPGLAGPGWRAGAVVSLSGPHSGPDETDPQPEVF